MSYQLVTPPTLLPVSLDQAKAQLRVYSADEDGRITEMIRRAARHVEQQCGVSLTATTWRLHLDEFPAAGGVIQLRKPPVTSITHVMYYDAANVQQTLDSSAYDTDLVGKPARIRPVDGTTWPSRYRRLNAVEVEFVAGAASVDDVPAEVQQLILLLIERWYEPEADAKLAASSAAAIEALLFDVRWASHA